MIRASLLLAAAFAAAPFLRRRSSAERHVLWAAAILLAALVPLSAGAVPRWRPGFLRHAAAVIPDVPFLSLSPSARDDADTGDVVVHAQSIETSNRTLRAVRAGCVGGLAVLLIFSVRGGWHLRRYRREQAIARRRRS